MQQGIEARFRTLITLWFGILMSVVLYFVLTFVAGPEINPEQTQSNAVVIVALTVIGMTLVITGFVLKGRFLRQAVDRQEALLVQKGYLISFAFCEVSALFGLLERFAFGYRYYYGLLALAAISIAIQFPRREHILAATFKNSNKI
ncbi:MAG TPA: hypothetical protein VN643_00745 [Pyrinomonadaceae bacterium]|nr:hypothetical protein [Pyrinomonadaceae bacterium]